MDDNEYWLCCSNVIGSKDRWLIYLKRHAKGMFGRNLAPIKAARSSLKVVRNVIEENDEINDVSGERPQIKTQHTQLAQLSEAHDAAK